MYKIAFSESFVNGTYDGARPELAPLTAGLGILHMNVHVCTCTCAYLVVSLNAMFTTLSEYM